MAKTAHVNVRLQSGEQKARPGVILLRDAAIVGGLCVIGTFLVGIAMIYLALNRIWPALAPVHGRERLRVWSRQERTWR